MPRESQSTNLDNRAQLDMRMNIPQPGGSTTFGIDRSKGFGNNDGF